MMFWVDANSIVANGELPLTVFLFGAHVDLRMLPPLELDGVSQEVLEHLKQLYIVAHHRGQRIVGQCSAALGDRDFKIGHRSFINLLTVHRFEWFALGTDP